MGGKNCNKEIVGWFTRGGKRIPVFKSGKMSEEGKQRKKENYYKTGHVDFGEDIRKSTHEQRMKHIGKRNLKHNKEWVRKKRTEIESRAKDKK